MTQTRIPIPPGLRSDEGQPPVMTTVDTTAIESLARIVGRG